MKTLYDLYKENAEAEGATIVQGDTILVILRKWVTAVGGTPKPGDFKGVLLRKLAIALGKNPLPGDTHVGILRKIADGNQTDTEYWCLLKLLP